MVLYLLILVVPIKNYLVALADVESRLVSDASEDFLSLCSELESDFDFKKVFKHSINSEALIHSFLEGFLAHFSA
jgi:hypothetical protein